jgi:predicted nucleic acid-binding protein
MVIGSCVVDTNILLRITRRSDPHHQLVDMALAQLVRQGATLHYTHQNIAELWNVMTRPLDRNGLGLTVNEAESEVCAIERGMTLLPDNEAIYHEWRKSSFNAVCREFRCMTHAWRRQCMCTAWPTSSPSM